MKSLLLSLTVTVSLLLSSRCQSEDGPTASIGKRSSASFQQGVNGYRGTVDTEIWALAPHTISKAIPTPPPTLTTTVVKVNV
jgi:hypothetical protein